MDISRYLRENDNDEVRQEHFGHLMSGREVWNAWVEGIQETLSVNGHDVKEYIINLSNQRFESPKANVLDFSNYIFPFDIVFDGSIFLESTTWHECRFQQSVNFKNVTFDAECDFSDSFFLKSLSFDKVTFKGSAIFIECDFDFLSFLSV